VERNFDAYGHKLAPLSDEQQVLYCDPQTSGGLLIAVRPENTNALEQVLIQAGVYSQCIGELIAATNDYRVAIQVDSPG
jgi:selenide,water dikinase